MAVDWVFLPDGKPTLSLEPAPVDTAFAWWQDDYVDPCTQASGRRECWDGLSSGRQCSYGRLSALPAQDASSPQRD